MTDERTRLAKPAECIACGEPADFAFDGEPMHDMCSARLDRLVAAIVQAKHERNRCAT